MKHMKHGVNRKCWLSLVHGVRTWTPRWHPEDRGCPGTWHGHGHAHWCLARSTPWVPGNPLRNPHISQWKALKEISTEESTSSTSFLLFRKKEGRFLTELIPSRIQPLLRHMEAHVASMGKATGHIYDSTDLLGISGLVEGKIYRKHQETMVFPFPHQTLGAFGFNFPLNQSSDWNQRHYPNVPLAFEDWNLRPHTTWSRMLSLMLPSGKLT